ncbi:MAG: diguanylate cyclase, partial [Acidobacteria bacterium]|nr:diguanylate cyclase [Acidobacteriota bacterium]
MSDSARAQQAQHQENLEELFALVYQDDLTGLHNRRFFSRKLVAPLDQTPGESPYVFLLVDIDHFKEINDTHGHAAGDKALTCLADMLRGWVKGDEQALRYAGDEFLLFLPGADPASGMRRAEDLVQMARLLRVPVNGGDESFGLTLSVGTACRPENGKGWEDVLEKADEALYAVKQRGRDGASLPPEEGAIFRGDDLSRIFPCPRFVAPEILLQPILGEIADWREAAADAEPNRAASLFRVSGGRGSGKTRLLAELAKNAGSRGYAVLRIHGSEQMHRLPYGCLTGGLLAATETSEELREAALPYWSREDAALWEIFFAAEPGARRSLDQDTVNRFYAGLLLGFAGGRDLLLLADDAERLDPETRGMLEDSPDFRPPSLRMFSVLVANTPVPPPPQSGTGDAEPTAPPPAQEAVAGQSTV